MVYDEHRWLLSNLFFAKRNWRKLDEHCVVTPLVLRATIIDRDSNTVNIICYFAANSFTLPMLIHLRSHCEFCLRRGARSSQFQIRVERRHSVEVNKENLWRLNATELSIKPNAVLLQHATTLGATADSEPRLSLRPGSHCTTAHSEPWLFFCFLCFSLPLHRCLVLLNCFCTCLFYIVYIVMNFIHRYRKNHEFHHLFPVTHRVSNISYLFNCCKSN